MNRNTNAHFSELPSVDIQRSILDRSHSHKLSGNVGDLIPIFCDADILPGDTVSIDTSKVIRFQTMLSPFMDNIQADIYFFFVPNRLIWDHWQNFMGQNDTSAWVPQVEYSVPKLTVKPADADNPNSNRVGTILDYLGFPVENTVSNKDVNALPVRAYAKICEDWFRDENLSDPINLYTGDNTVVATKEASYINDVPHGGAPFKVAKYHDYFTSCLPFPQKGSPVNINLGVSVPELYVSTRKADTNHVYPVAQDASYPGVYATVQSGKITSGWSGVFDRNGSSPYNIQGTSLSDSSHLTPINLWTSGASLSASFTVNDLRYAFQLQKLLERDARGGTRYIETIRAHFGVVSPDARMQRSEYLGGNRFAIEVDQVCNTAQTESDFLGDLGAFSVTSDVHSDFTHSFTEHGVLMGLLCIRYDHTYAQGLHKMWSRDDRFSYFWPEFSAIGEQPVLKQEIFCDGSSNDSAVFGYNEAYADYRYLPNRVSGEMRPYVTNGLFSWTLADDYESVPSLSDGWIRESESNVDRVLAVTSENAHQFWADIYFNCKYTRPMPVYSIPGLIDHF